MKSLQDTRINIDADGGWSATAGGRNICRGIIEGDPSEGTISITKEYPHYRPEWQDRIIQAVRAKAGQTVTQ